MDDWKIHRDRAPCERPHCPLPTASEFYAVLELPDCTRRDLCAACFEQLAAAPGPTPIYWKARRAAAGKRAPSLDLVSLRVLFDRLGEVDGERAQGLRYFVALLLIRKRVLKIVDPQDAREEQADFVVVDPKLDGAPRVALFAPELDAQRMASLKDELLEALEEHDTDDAPAGESASA